MTAGINQSLDKISHWSIQQGYGSIAKTKPVAGGCINSAYRLITTSGKSFFVKMHLTPPPGFFQREAEGLHAIGAAEVIRVPDVLLVDDAFLVLEDISPGQHDERYWDTFAKQLAQLHTIPQKQFGFISDNYCGKTLQKNTQCNDGHRFFADYRLQHQADLAVRNGRLSSTIRKRIDTICSNLTELIPTQPPSLIHGDLWSGNAHISPQGDPVLIDPACYWGWAEAELAMTQLFGGFPDRFYKTYLETNPLQQGWKERLPLYNLYHLLNHLNLFGESYLPQVRSVVDRYY